MTSCNATDLCGGIDGTDLVVPAGTASIDIGFLGRCQSARANVTYVFIAKSVTSIGANAFRSGYAGPDNVASIEFEAGSELTAMYESILCLFLGLFRSLAIGLCV